MLLNRSRLLTVSFMAALAWSAAFGQSQLPSQPPAPATAPQKLPAQALPAEPGLETPWDVRQILANMARDDEQLQLQLAQLNPQQWYDQKGAPGTYILQWQTAQRQLNDVIATSRLLSQKTESLPMALDVYFRLEALEVTFRSLEQGAQKYADRRTADHLSLLIAHNFNNRERFRDYLKDLADSVDQNFKIADQEAQRCRGMISREPPTTSSRKSKKD
jgi:hypothetical protein